MAKRKQESNAPKSAAKNKSSTAGKRQGQGKAAARTAPPKAPAKSAGKGAGQKSKSTNVANVQSQQAAPKSTSKKGGLFKFRRYKKAEGSTKKKAKHPKLIVDTTKNEYGYLGLTESEKSGHHKNIPLTKNPKKNDKRKAYLRKELRYDTFDNFGEILEDYNLSKEDKEAVIKFLEERKKKK